MLTSRTHVAGTSRGQQRGRNIQAGLGNVGEAKENSTTGNHRALLLEELSSEVALHIIKMGNSLKFRFLLSFYYENFCTHTQK